MSEKTAKLTGKELRDALLQEMEEATGEEVEFWDLEDTEGVENYERTSQGVDGWYETILHTFDYKGKSYEVEEISHVSDNVSDSAMVWDTFREVEQEKTVILYIQHEQNTNASYKELFDAQEMYEQMVKDGVEKTSVEVHGVPYLTGEIREYPGIISEALLELVYNRVLHGEENISEIVKVAHT